MTANAAGADELSRYDVVIIGGGLAGLTLARQLALARPTTRILIVEKHAFPVPEAAFKVGESSAEVGARYFNKVLGLRDHLRTNHLRKMGLRFFAPAGDNTDITRRVEHGPPRFPPVSTFQLDRGRLENFLAADSSRLGIELRSEYAVRQVKLGTEGHQVVVRQDDREETVTARWVVDASGRSALLARQLDLRVPVEHDVNAVWFRIDTVIDVDEWSEDVAWHTRVPRGLRHFSTCHLAGRGYWVWLIPLAGGVTSVGIVADPAFHALSDLTHLEDALDWIRRHEPQLAAVIEPYRDRILDFKALRHFAHGCRQVYSADRWALTGEAGPFSDPLYSPGSDFIAIGNTFISDLILRGLAGEDIHERVVHHNDLYLALFQNVLHTFAKQYRMLGNPQTIMAKAVWDQAYWWGLPGLLYFRNKLIDPAFMASIAPLVTRHFEVQIYVQKLLREWDLVECREWEGGHVSFGIDEFPVRLHFRLATPLTDEELVPALEENVRTVESVALHFWAEITRRTPQLAARPDLDPARAIPHAVLPDSAEELERLVPASVRRVWQNLEPAVSARGA